MDSHKFPSDKYLSQFTAKSVYYFYILRIIINKKLTNLCVIHEYILIIDFGIPNANTAHTFVYILGWCFYHRAENTFLQFIARGNKPTYKNFF